MGSQATTTTTRRDMRLERYLAAERRYWAAAGLDPRESEVRVGAAGSRLRVQEVGEGEPLVYIHGTGGSAAYFAPLLAALPGFRHIVIDRPGWVASEPVDYCRRPYTAIAVETIRGVLDSAGIERAHVVGASIGNLWAMRFALAEPSRVARVVFLGGGPISPDVAVPPFIRLLRSPIGRLIVRLPERPGMFRKQLAGMGHAASLSSGRIDDAFVEWHGALTRDTDWARHEREMVRCIVGRGGFVDGLVPSRSEVAALRAPALMVLGTADPVGDRSVWQRFVADTPAAELDLVADGGHVVWLDDPARVGGRMARFLRA
jgi:pimeloyl-ACP methyl ester carboxylesterase